MAGHMLVLAPGAIFVIALALAFDVPRRLKDGLARLRRTASRRRVATNTGAGFSTPAAATAVAES